MNRSHRLRLHPLALVLLCGTPAALPAAANAPAFTGPQVSGRLTAPPKNEASGLAASRRMAEVLWTHDDSGGAPMLYAVDADGRARGKLQVGGVKNQDWEDVAAVELDGKPWLLVGDIGDNEAERRSVTVYFVPEPSAAELSLSGQFAEQPAATLRLTYEDGPRDCESLAIDPAERAIYLLTKRDAVPRLYRATLPDGPLADAEVRASFIGLVPHLPKPTAAQALLKGHRGKQRARPCAMDFAPDGSAAVVLTYGDVLLFPRERGESWAETLARPPIVLGAHDLPQAEGICFSAEARTLYVASESSRTLLRYDRK